MGEVKFGLTQKSKTEGLDFGLSPAKKFWS